MNLKEIDGVRITVLDDNYTDLLRADNTPVIRRPSIPYRETRAYVQRIMEYAAIYQHRLGSPDPALTLGARMKPVLPGTTSDPG